MWNHAFMGLALQLMALLADGDWSASFRVMGVGEGLELSDLEVTFVL